MEEGGVEFAVKAETVAFVPAEGRTAVADVQSEGNQVEGRRGEFENPAADPVA